MSKARSPREVCSMTMGMRLCHRACWDCCAAASAPQGVAPSEGRQAAGGRRGAGCVVAALADRPAGHLWQTVSHPFRRSRPAP